MTKNVMALAAIALALCAASCIGKVNDLRALKGKVAKQLTVTTAFSAVSTTCDADIDYVEGPTAIKLIGPKKIIDNYKVVVKNGTLEISCKNSAMMRDSDVKLYISSRGVNKFITTGSGDIDIKSPLSAKSLNFLSTGTGDIEMVSIQADNIEMKTTGTGDIEAKSVTGNLLNADTYGTGDIEIASVSLQSANLRSTGTGDIEINRGTCAKVNQMSSGTGKIEVNCR